MKTANLFISVMTEVGVRPHSSKFNLVINSGIINYHQSCRMHLSVAVKPEPCLHDLKFLPKNYVFISLKSKYIYQNKKLQIRGGTSDLHQVQKAEKKQVKIIS